MAKSNSIPIRFDDEDFALAEKITDETGLVGPDVLRRSLRALYKQCLSNGFGPTVTQYRNFLALDGSEVADGARKTASVKEALQNKSGVKKAPIKRKVASRKFHSDIREAAFYADSSSDAGIVSGEDAGNPPIKIPIPPEWMLPVDFVVPVRGDSMKGLIDDGELAAFTKATTASNGQLVSAWVRGTNVLKMYHVAGGRAELRSLNPDRRYKPIEVTEDVRIQGHYQGIFPPLSKGTLKKIKAETK